MIRQKSRSKSKVPMTIMSIQDSPNTSGINKTSSYTNMQTIPERRAKNSLLYRSDAAQKININQSPPRK